MLPYSAADVAGSRTILASQTCKRLWWIRHAQSLAAEALGLLQQIHFNIWWVRRQELMISLNKSAFLKEILNWKLSLAPYAVLTSRFAHANNSAQPFIHTKNSYSALALKIRQKPADRKLSMLWNFCFVLFWSFVKRCLG